MAALPTISIITVSFNAVNWIEACINGVASQTYPNTEHIIVDGLSTDGTVDHIRKFSKLYPNLRYISEKDEGIYDAMNKGLEMASGDWIYFLGTDDVFNDREVLNQLFSGPMQEQYDVIYGDVLFKFSGERYAGSFDLDKLYQQNICHQAIFVRKNLFTTEGNFNLRYKIWADYDFNLKWMAKATVRKLYLDKIIAVYNEAGFSSTRLDEKFLQDKYDLFVNAGMKLPLVSVIIPNYNHAPFLKKRIDSILDQTFQDFEIILLDDCSTDDSLVVLNAYKNHPKVSKAIFNEQNSGSTFLQWNKGIGEARGAYIWIAESDDYAAPKFLEALVKELNTHPCTSLAYCQSWRVDKNDDRHGTWLSHTDSLDAARWKSPYTSSGISEIQNYLLYRNTIPNASAVVFRKKNYLETGGADPSIEKCGDWYLWMKLLLKADISYIPEHYNYFRFHANSVIATARNIASFYDLYMRIQFHHLVMGLDAPATYAPVLALNSKLLNREQGVLGLWQMENKQVKSGIKNFINALLASGFDRDNAKHFLKKILKSVKLKTSRSLKKFKQ